MTLRLNGSTSGYSQIDAPAVAGDQTFTLPGTGGTLDRLNRAGNILQVVQTSTSTEVIVSTTTFTDTNLTATITPTSATSKILVMVDQQAAAVRSSSTCGLGLRLLRDSTVIHDSVSNATGPYDFFMAATGASATQLYTRASITYLDSPSTTSALTYKTQGRPQSTSTGTATFQSNGDTVDGTSYITLIEVAA